MIASERPLMPHTEHHVVFQRSVSLHKEVSPLFKMLVPPLGESLNAIPLSLLTHMASVRRVNFNASLFELLLVGIVFFFRHTGFKSMTKPFVGHSTVRVNRNVVYLVNLGKNLSYKFRAFVQDFIDIVVLVLVVF